MASSTHDTCLLVLEYVSLPPEFEGEILKWILDTERGGELVSKHFGKFSTFHKLAKQQIFISFSQSIYIK